MNLLTTASLGLAIAFATPAGAQQGAASPSDTVPTHRIAEVTVTVTRAEGTRYALPRQIDVVDRTDIERTPATDVADLLKKQANVDIIQFPGLLSGVGIRGFRPQFSGINQRTLVLIDGRPAGATNLALLGLNDVERVEVLRGPASSLYGSAAMGGVVNVVTRRSTGAVRGNARLAYGAWDTREAVASAGGAVTDRLEFDLSLATHEQGRDYRVGNGNLFRGWMGESTVVRTFPDGTTEESEEEGDGQPRPFSRYGTRSGSARVAYHLAPAWKMETRVERFEADRVQNPGDLFATWGDSRSLKDVARTSGDVALRGTVDRHDLTVRVYAAREDGSNYNGPEATETQPQFINFESRSRWHGLQVQDALSFGDHTLVAGLDYTVTEAASDRFSPGGAPIAPWESDSRIATRSAFAEGRIRSHDHRFVATLGGRLDQIGFEVKPSELHDSNPDVQAIAAGNKESFTIFNPSFGAQYLLPGGVRAHASGGRAFIAPGAFNVAGYVERRSPDGTARVTRGNPDLRPEHSFTWDAGIGLVRLSEGLEADVTYFQTRVGDRITTQSVTPPAGARTPGGDSIASIATYANADEATLRGLEWRISADLLGRPGHGSRLNAFAGATHLFEAEEVIGGTPRPVRSVANRTINAGVQFDRGERFSSRLTGRYVGNRTDDDWNTWPAAVVQYPAFVTLDWTGEVGIADRYRVGLLISNLTDENYYEVRGYPLAGRAAQLRVSVEF